jgi:DNA-directed RNA polymerase beta subunit
VALMHYGETYEDGVIMSSEVSEDLMHVSIIDLEYVVSASTIVSNIAKVGTELVDNDIIIKGRYPIEHQTVNRISNQIKSKDGKIVVTEKIVDKDLKVPLDLGRVIVSDIHITKGVTIPLDSETESAINKVTSTYSKDRSTLASSGKVDEDYVNLNFSPSLVSDPTKNKAVICIRLIHLNTLKTGNKMVNRYGSKGLTSYIRDKNDMPVLSDGRRVQAILNSDSTVGRKIVSQLLELSLTNLSREILKEKIKRF